MKKIIFLFISVFFYDGAGAQESPKRINYDSLKVMPPFQYYTIEGNAFTQADLKKKKQTVFIFIKMGCPYCAEELEIIKKNISDFSNTQFYLVSRADSSELKKFYSDYALIMYPQINILWDKDRKYYKYTIARVTPSIHIYDNKKRLLIFSEGVMNKVELSKYID